MALSSIIARAQQPPIAQILTYRLIDCPAGSFLIDTSSYTLPEGTCTSLVPNANTPLVPFLSFRAGAGNEQAQDPACHLDIFSEASCGGNHESYPIGTVTLGAIYAECQEVDVLLGGGEVGVGGRSGKLVC